MIDWFRRYLTKRRAIESHRFLTTTWVNAWLALPGADLPVPQDLERLARSVANQAVDSRHWRHHRNRVRAYGDKRMKDEIQVAWATAIRAARGAAVHVHGRASGTLRKDPLAVLTRVNHSFPKTKFDPEPDPLAAFTVDAG